MVNSGFHLAAWACRLSIVLQHAADGSWQVCLHGAAAQAVSHVPLKPSIAAEIVVYTCCAQQIWQSCAAVTCQALNGVCVGALFEPHGIGFLR